MAHQELSDLRLTQQPWRSGNRWTAGTRILAAATAQKNEIPIVETSEAETSLLVEDGATLILGGLIKEKKSKDHQRIPHATHRHRQKGGMNR